MRLYRILGTSWAGTQADAKAASKEAGRPWHEYEVPTDKAGLLAFLVERNVAASTDELDQVEKLTQPLEREPLDLPIVPPAKPIFEHSHNSRALSQESFTAGEICEFIHERASVAQVENIMAALGTRFAELARERKRA